MDAFPLFPDSIVKKAEKQKFIFDAKKARQTGDINNLAPEYHKFFSDVLSSMDQTRFIGWAIKAWSNSISSPVK